MQKHELWCGQEEVVVNALHCDETRTIKGFPVHPNCNVSGPPAL